MTFNTSQDGKTAWVTVYSTCHCIVKSSVWKIMLRWLHLLPYYARNHGFIVKMPGDAVIHVPFVLGNIGKALQGGMILKERVK